MYALSWFKIYCEYQYYSDEIKQAIFSHLQCGETQISQMWQEKIAQQRVSQFHLSYSHLQKQRFNLCPVQKFAGSCWAFYPTSEGIFRQTGRKYKKNESRRNKLEISQAYKRKIIHWKTIIIPHISFIHSQMWTVDCIWKDSNVWRIDHKGVFESKG